MSDMRLSISIAENFVRDINNLPMDEVHMKYRNLITNSVTTNDKTVTGFTDSSYLIQTEQITVLESHEVAKLLLKIDLHEIGTTKRLPLNEH